MWLQLSFTPPLGFAESGHIVDKSTPSEKVGRREGEKKKRKQGQHSMKSDCLSAGFFPSVMTFIMFYWFSCYFLFSSRMAWSKAMAPSTISVFLTHTHVFSVTYTQTHIVPASVEFPNIGNKTAISRTIIGPWLKALEVSTIPRMHMKKDARHTDLHVVQSPPPPPLRTRSVHPLHTVFSLKGLF